MRGATRATPTIATTTGEPPSATPSWRAPNARTGASAHRQQPTAARPLRGPLRVPTSRRRLRPRTTDGGAAVAATRAATRAIATATATATATCATAMATARSRGVGAARASRSVTRAGAQTAPSEAALVTAPSIRPSTDPMPRILPKEGTGGLLPHHTARFDARLRCWLLGVALTQRCTAGWHGAWQAWRRRAWQAWRRRRVPSRPQSIQDTHITSLERTQPLVRVMHSWT